MAGPLRFGRYETLFRIASGGMAEVFAARVRSEPGFEKLVAVKRIVPHLAEDAAFVHMFLDEARLAAHVSSPHVVQTLDLGRATDDSLYIAMELVVGVTLSELMAAAADRLPVGVAIEIAAQAADGLHDAHEARTPGGEPLEIVHRDVSPQNVLVGVDGRVKLTDFGIARAAQGRLTHTEHGQLKGKFAYFSPEQSRAAQLDRRSDVFALGVVAWEMLAGDRLFAGATPAETIVAVRRAEIPDLHALRPEVPASIARVIEGALARDPQDRTASAAELARQLRAAAHEADVVVGNADIAAYLRDARVAKVEQLRDRIRAALESPDVRTLPDIELAPAAPVGSTTAVPRGGAPADRDAQTVVLDDEPATVTAPSVHEGRTVSLDAPSARSKSPWIAAALGALAVVGLAAYGAVAGGLGDREQASTPEDDPRIASREVEPGLAIEPAPAAIDGGNASASGEAHERPVDGGPEIAVAAHVSPTDATSEPRVEAATAADPTSEAAVEDASDVATSWTRTTSARPRPARRRPRAPPSRESAVGAPAGLDAFERGVPR